MRCKMYSLDVRKMALKLYDHFKSLRKVSKIIGICPASLSRWNKNINPKNRTAKCSKMTDALKSFIIFNVLKNPLLTTIDLVQMIFESFQMKISRQLVHLILKRENITYKRIRTRGVSKKKEELTKEFIEKYKQIISINKNVVSIDESGFDQRGKQTYGYSMKGTKAIVSHGLSSKHIRYNLIYAISREDGKHAFELTTEKIKGAQFSNFINQLAFPKGTVVMLDNASIHKTKEFRDAITKKGYSILYTPPYSPEFNPIELVFGKFKNTFYKARLIEKSFNTKAVVESIVSQDHSLLIQKCFSHVEKKYIL